MNCEHHMNCILNTSDPPRLSFRLRILVYASEPPLLHFSSLVLFQGFQPLEKDEGAISNKHYICFISLLKCVHRVYIA